MLVGSGFVFFGLLILKYNLVKGSWTSSERGCFEISRRPFLLSKETTVLRANPKADEVFGVSEWMERPENERLVDKIIPGFHGARQFDLPWIPAWVPKLRKLSNVYRWTRCSERLLVFHDVTESANWLDED